MTPEPSLLHRLNHVERRVDKMPTPAPVQDEDEPRFEVIEERVLKVEQRASRFDHVLDEYRRAEALR